MNKQYFKKFAVILSAACALSAGVGAFASDNSATVIPAEGNVQCNDYAANKVILSMDTSSPVVSGTVAGPENPADPDSAAASTALP